MDIGALQVILVWVALLSYVGMYKVALFILRSRVLLQVLCQLGQHNGRVCTGQRHCPIHGTIKEQLDLQVPVFVLTNEEKKYKKTMDAQGCASHLGARPSSVCRRSSC